MIDIDKYKTIALERLSPIKPIDDKTIAKKDFLFSAVRSDSGRKLADYYLVYFLFADLLGFKNLGQFEKVAWSFPIDYNGKAFLIEHRKFGVGVFVQDKEKDEVIAEEITKKINSAVKSIKKYYDYIAEKAVLGSKFNVVNNNRQLFQRFDYLLKLYKEEYNKYIDNKGKTEKITGKSEYGEYMTIKSLDFEFKQNSNWLAISCIESFFSWTEHLFIHLAIIQNGLCDGEKISTLIGDEWKKKFKAAISMESKESQQFYNELIIVRQQLRNFIAHGSFGKDGNAFRFHSGAGAVPVIMSHKRKKNKFSLQGTLSFNEQSVIELIERFVEFLWNSESSPAMHYTQKCTLPAILSYASDGTYETLSKEMDLMVEFSEKIMHDFDTAANMDW